MNDDWQEENDKKDWLYAKLSEYVSIYHSTADQDKAFNSLLNEYTNEVLARIDGRVTKYKHD